jgi:lipopolysaccharide export system permease protein
LTGGKDADTGAVALKILQRYVIFEVVRAFSLALLTMSAIFVLFMVAAQARDVGLSPQDIVELVPYVLPSTLPYTIPVSLLFAVTVVYGRLAGDNEIIAVKTAGLSVTKILWPTFGLAIGLSLLLLHLSGGWIPDCTHQAKMVLYRDMEDMFYKMLSRDHEFNGAGWPFLIVVKDVHGKDMISPTFKHKVRARGKGSDDYDLVIKAKRAVLRFDLPAKVVRVYFDQAEIQHYRHDSDVVLINDRELEIPIPPDSKFNADKKIQEYTNADLMAELRNLRRSLENERRREAIKCAFAYGTGRIERIEWGTVQDAFINHGYNVRQCDQLETEWWQRIAMACGSLLFVVLGAPVGIMFARRDFLSAFITCFLPIITCYYPLMLLGSNMSKEGIVLVPNLPPYSALWFGNVILAVLAGLVLPPVIRH